MKKLLLIAALATAAYVGFFRNPNVSLVENLVGTTSGSDKLLAGAFEDHRSNFQVEAEGIVTRILSDDSDGGRHQRFVVRLHSGQTLLVAHNIDLAPRVSALREGDTVSFNGEYEWNPEGGVIHWTHHDPAGRRATGWIKHGGQTYQ